MIKITNLSKKYGDRYVLKDLNITFPNRGFIVIKGPNGTGKTTLLNIIGLLDTNYQGQIQFDDQIIDKNEKKNALLRKSHINYIFQKDNLIDFLNASENLNLGNEVKEEFTLLPKSFKNKLINELSEGEKILVSLQQGISSKKKIYLLDEVSAFLDEDNLLKIIKTIKQLAKNNLVIFVTHDIRLDYYASCVLHMIDGKFRETIPFKEDTPRHLAESTVFKKRVSLFLYWKVMRKNLFTFVLNVILMSFLFAIFFFYTAVDSYKMPKSNYVEALTNGYVWLRSLNQVDVTYDNQVIPLQANQGNTLAVQDFFAQKYPSDIFYFTGSVYLVDDESYPSEMVLTKEYIKQYANFIDGDYIQLTVNTNKAWIKYQTGEATSKFLNIKSVEHLVFANPLVIDYSIWQNPNIDFKKDIVSIVNGLGNNVFVSESMLKKRGMSDINMTNDEIYIDDTLNQFLVNEKTQFFDLKKMNFQQSDFGYVNMADIFNQGVYVKSNESIANLLNNKEILVSDEMFDKISSQLRLYKEVLYKIDDENKSDFIDLVLQNDLKIACDSQAMDEINMIMTAIKYQQSSAKKYYLASLVLIVLISAIYANFLYKHNKKNITILKSRGFHQSKNIFLALSLSLTLSSCIAGMITSIPIFANYNEEFANIRYLENFPKYGITLFQVILTLGLLGICTFITSLMFYEKTKQEQNHT